VKKALLGFAGKNLTKNVTNGTYLLILFRC